MVTGADRQAANGSEASGASSGAKTASDLLNISARAEGAKTEKTDGMEGAERPFVSRTEDLKLRDLQSY